MAPRLGWPSWVGVVVDDLARMGAFYRDVLGMRETEAGKGWIQFELDGRMFEVIQRSELPQYAARRYQVGYTVEDIDAARHALIEAGVVPISDVEGGDDTANRWCYFRDPEGNVFEITQWLDRGHAPEQPGSSREPRSRG